MSETHPIDDAAAVRRHLMIGWWSLLLFAGVGLVLESLHGFKVEWYLGVAHETRRHLWTLAHAHGVLLALVNLGFAATLSLVPAASPRRRQVGSAALFGATALVPLGFGLGGVWTYGGDPGLGVLLVPVGGVLLLIAVTATAVEATASRRSRH